MNVYRVIDTTTDDRTYRSIKRLKLYESEGKCFWCTPHGGCNSRYNKWYGRPNSSWKNYRVKQYK